PAATAVREARPRIPVTRARPRLLRARTEPSAWSARQTTQPLARAKPSFAIREKTPVSSACRTTTATGTLPYAEVTAFAQAVRTLTAAESWEIDVCPAERAWNAPSRRTIARSTRTTVGPAYAIRTRWSARTGCLRWAWKP